MLERDGPRDAVATYIEQTKLLVALASAFIVAPAAVIPLVVGKDAISVVASHVTDLTRAELAQVGSVCAGYVVLATIAGYQNVGKYEVDRPATRVFSYIQIVLYVVGLYLFGQFLINVLNAAKVQAPKTTSVISLRTVADLPDGGKPGDQIVAPEEMKHLADDIGAHNALGGDILLLLGSADCIPTKPKKYGGRWDNNIQLAQARAEWVRDSIKRQLAGASISLRIEPYALPQHTHCRKTSDVRAVYPFLVHTIGN